MAQKPSIPKGTRDFSPEEMIRRNYIFDTIKTVFSLYGYQAIETPAMENLSTLLGKYGEEGDKLLFKIVNSGDFLSKVSREKMTDIESLPFSTMISDKGLKYDLTVPFARYVVQHRNEINFPFKRYQIQPVWRADRPQRGRYREFYQCDVDVIGSDSLLNEVELIQIIDDVFKRLKIKTEVKLNNRKILAGIAEVIGEADKIIDITVAIDKLDKIGLDKVNEELIHKGVSQTAVDKLEPIILLKGKLKEKFESLSEILKDSEIGMKGIEESMTVMNQLKELELETKWDLDLTLARGLNYYTGAIIEVKATDVNIGSICGGGRYDDLTGIFGMPDVSGVGISFGADRIYDVMNELNIFPDNKQFSTKLMFVNFGDTEAKHCLKIVSEIRKKGISVELFPDNSKTKKQLNYANKKGIPYVALIGENEMKEGIINLKNMQSGEQKSVSLEKLIKELS